MPCHATPHQRPAKKPPSHSLNPSSPLPLLSLKPSSPSPVLNPGLTNQPGDLPRQIIRLPPRGRLGINPHRLLRPARARKRPPLFIFPHESVDLVLDADGRLEAAFGIDGDEEVAIGDLDAHEPIGQVRVGGTPLLGPPALVREDDFDKEEVGEGVADGLVDEADEGAERLQRGVLGGGLGFVFAEAFEGRVGEEDGAVAVGFEVDADVEFGRGVVEVLDARVGADDGQLEVVRDVFGAGAVGVRRLYDADLESRETGALGEVADEEGGQSGDAVAVEEAEAVFRVDKVVDYSVSIAVE